jgi:tRNA(Arg) A34 adenosine deaminase TadA
MNRNNMQKAIESGWEAFRRGDEPFGSCIVKDGEIIVSSGNSVNTTQDVTAHAEINAVREACKISESNDLSGCEIYATFKPCPMCIEAIKKSGISTIYYGAGPEDVYYPSTEKMVTIKRGVLLKECLELSSKKYMKK